MTDPFVVVGGGLAAGAAVQALRDEGEDGPVVVVGAEPHLPYERPPLSKEYLQGTAGRDVLELFSRERYEEWGVEVREGLRAVALDPAARTVRLDDGDTLRYRALLLATGGRPRVLMEPSERIRYLRTVEDADAIRSHLGGGRRLLVVGAGFIGCEVAASARAVGADVTVVDPAPAPLHRVLGEEMGNVVARLHRDHGVEVRLGERVTSLEETGGGVLLETEGGGRHEGDLAVVGVGIVPNTELAEEAGLEVDNGIVVDERCAASAEGIFAAGDVASHAHPIFGRIRVEHFDNALKMGAHAGRAMLGATEPFDDPHWFWSDQYDENLQMCGYAASWDDIVVRGSVEDRSFTAFYLSDGVLRSVLSLGRPRDVRRAMRLVAAQVRPEPRALRDDDVELASLLTGAGR